MNFVRRAIRSLIRETRIKEAINKEAVGKEALGKEALGKETVGKETIGKEALGKEALGKEALSKESAGKETLREDTARGERAAKETVDEFFAKLSSATPQRVGDLTKKPWSAICRVESFFAASPDRPLAQGSGFLISSRMVLTAAHILYSKKNGEAREVSLIFGNPTDNKRKRVTATRFVYDKRFAEQLKNSGSQKTDSSSRQAKAVEEDPSYYDYAAIFLDEEITPKPEFFFRVVGMDPDDPRWDKKLRFAGYWADEGTELYYVDGAAHPDGKERFDGSKSNLVVHRAVSHEGQSGGPLYLLDDSGEYDAVVGIQVRLNEGKAKGQTNGAVRITKDMQKAFEFWEGESRKTNSQLGKGKRDLDVDTQNLIA